MALNWNGEEIERQSAPVTLPVFRLPDIDIEAEAREAAARVAERRTIRLGLDAWRLIGKAQSFDAWRAIGAALLVGKRQALAAIDTNSPWWARRYGHKFSQWLKANGFASMTPSIRSVAIELAENINAIEQWRATLPERQRKRLIHPLSNVRRWRAATTYNGKSPADYKMEAVAAWRKFLSCVAALPPADQAACGTWSAKRGLPMRRRPSRTRTRRVTVPPDRELKAAARKLRERAGDDPAVAALCDDAEKLAAGYTIRRGPFDARRWPLHEAWGGKEPPENP